MITVLWCCKGCNVEDGKAMVRYRKDGEDIMPYLDLVREKVRAAHEARSPKCTALVFDLKIPLNEDPNKGIGTQP